MAQKFIFDDGKSRKFWAIELKGRALVITYGRIGTEGRSLEKHFPSPSDARSAHSDLVYQKIRKGYRPLSTTKPASRKADRKAEAVGATRTKRILASSIYRAAKRHGATIDEIRELPEAIEQCPDFIAEFYQRIIWPKRHEFDGPMICKPGHKRRHDPAEDGLRFISFNLLDHYDHERHEIKGCRGMALFAIGQHDGGNWILLLDGNDRNRKDPTVHCVDHYNPGQEIWNYGRLSKFLANLRSRRQ